VGHSTTASKHLNQYTSNDRDISGCGQTGSHNENLRGNTTPLSLRAKHEFSPSCSDGGRWGHRPPPYPLKFFEEKKNYIFPSSLRYNFLFFLFFFSYCTKKILDALIAYPQSRIRGKRHTLIKHQANDLSSVETSGFLFFFLLNFSSF
jgi:hypothetical protein